MRASREGGLAERPAESSNSARRNDAGYVIPHDTLNVHLANSISPIDHARRSSNCEIHEIAAGLLKIDLLLGLGLGCH